MTTAALEQLRAFTFTARTRSLLGFRPESSGRALPNLRRDGLFWTFPVFTASTAGLSLGVRLVPGIELLADMPLLLIQGDRAMTLATTLRSGLALAMIALALDSEPGNNWSILLERRAEAEAELAGFEAILGGDSVGPLFDVLADQDLRERLQGSREVRRDALVDLYERLDPEQGAVRRWIRSGAPPDQTPAPRTPAWQQVIRTANLKRALREHAGFDPIDASWQLFAGPVALDAALTGRVRQPENIRWVFKRWTGLHAARTLRDAADDVPKERRDDPLWPAVISLAERGEACDGLVFVEAAAHLEESGQPERALAALAAAAYLSSHALGQALSPIVEAAAFTAGRHGWSLLESLFAQTD